MDCQFVTPNLVILFSVRECSWFASSSVCANANLIVITPKEQTGAESIVYSAGTVTRSSSFTKPGFKNRITPEQTITVLILYDHLYQYKCVLYAGFDRIISGSFYTQCMWQCLQTGRNWH